MCETEIYDLDKAWHGIHFLLTGTPEGGEFPLNFIAHGGKEIGEDIGYGPLRVLFSKEVEELKQRLEKMPVNDIAKKYNIEALNKNEIYPLTNNWTEEDKSWLIEEYDGLRNFIIDASKNQKIIFVAIV